MPTLTRRALLANISRAATSAAILAPAFKFLSAQNRGQLRSQIGPDVQSFQQQFRVPAMSASITRNGRFTYDHAGGMADREHMAQAQQDSLFRIADLSKPITAVTIFSLIEQGKLHLTDKVFGPSGILSTYGKAPYKPYVQDVTVDHLLTHTAGGWSADVNDPMAHNDGWDFAKLIASTIDNMPLGNPPGTQWAYSNFGYCVLGRVIEKLTGQSYDAYVKTNILAPCGITTMQIAQNTERLRLVNEVVYTGQYSEDPYKINITRTDSTAGWIASSTQLVQFLNHVAGAPGIPALLKPETIQTMTTPTPVSPPNARYARGWMVGNGSWWHSGSLPGSTALMLRTPDGSCAAYLCNTRTQPHQEMDSALHQLLQTMLEDTSA